MTVSQADTDASRHDATAPPDSDGVQVPSRLARIMQAISKQFPRDPSGENVMAVRLFRRLDAARDLITAGALRRRLHRRAGHPPWPLVAGEYRVGDVTAGVAVCTLSSRDLIAPVSVLPGVAIAGRLITVNLGIERMVTNLLGNPGIRALVICGKDSPVFRTAQAIRALVENGVTAERRIIRAQGHWPVLGNLSSAQIARFRDQVMLVDAIGTSEIPTIARHVAAAAERVASLPPMAMSETAVDPPSRPKFKRIAAGGHREPIGYDPRGFFIITLDTNAGEIVCRQYSVDHAPAYEIRSHSAERILLGLLRADLVSRLSHAGYLGAELAKAETAQRLGLHYEQDRPLAAPTRIGETARGARSRGARNGDSAAP